jgi:hypothetical protein
MLIILHPKKRKTISKMEIADLKFLAIHPKGKCPPDPCNVFAGDCKPVRVCITNSTNFN